MKSEIGVRCNDSTGMVEWLRRVFDCEAQAIETDSQGNITHAELSIHNATIIVTPYPCQTDTDFSDWPSPPVGLLNAPHHRVAVRDCDAILSAAKNVGAEIITGRSVIRPGPRGFTCRDPEGQLWTVRGLTADRAGTR